MTAISPSEFSSALEACGPSWPVAVAVSGGADSMALLCLAASWAKAQGRGNDLVALSVDHGLRAESGNELAQVTEWCAGLDVRHHILRWEGGKPVANIQAEARAARYRLLGDWCEKQGARTLLTAHHLDDQAETFLMRLIRGSGVDGLSAMAASKMMSNEINVRHLRPLLSFSKNRLCQTLEELNQSWIEDPSNEDPNFMRVQVRELRDQFEDLGLPPQRLVETAERMLDAREVLNLVARSAFSDHVRIDPLGFVTLNGTGLAEEPRETGMRVVSQCVMMTSGNVYRPRFEKTERLWRGIVGKDTWTDRTLHGCLISRLASEFFFVREARQALPVVSLTSDESSTGVWDGRFHFEVPNPPGGIQIRHLGEMGLKVLHSEVPDLVPVGVPRGALLALPGLWEEETLRAAPLLGFGPGIADFRFLGPAPTAGPLETDFG